MLDSNAGRRNMREMRRQVAHRPCGKLAVRRFLAAAKGRRLGLFKPREEKANKAREKEPGERFLVEVLGRPCPPRTPRKAFGPCVAGT